MRLNKDDQKFAEACRAKLHQDIEAGNTYLLVAVHRTPAGSTHFKCYEVLGLGDDRRPCWVTCRLAYGLDFKYDPKRDTLVEPYSPISPGELVWSKLHEEFGLDPVKFVCSC